jgi:hypothetical protein
MAAPRQKRTYVVDQTVSGVVRLLVEASSAEEARRKAERGEVKEKIAEQIDMLGIRQVRWERG